MKPSVSVIIPHYNRPDMVGRALESVHQQTVQPLEVLLVDDQSTPANRAALQQFASAATILSTPSNVGLSGARNFGAQHAMGEWIAFLDDDDSYVPQKLELQLQYLAEHPEVEALGGGLTMITPDGTQEYWGGKPTRKLTLIDALQRTASMAQALIVRRDLFLAMGGFDPIFRSMEDYEFGIRLLSAGVEMHFLGEPMFLYHLGGGRDQLTRNWSRMIRSELAVIHKHAFFARQVFGKFGEVRLMAACCKKWGIRRGRLIGRSIWLLGNGLELIFGQISASTPATSAPDPM